MKVSLPSQTAVCSTISQACFLARVTSGVLYLYWFMVCMESGFSVSLIMGGKVLALSSQGLLS